MQQMGVDLMQCYPILTVIIHALKYYFRYTKDINLVVGVHLAREDSGN
jgi:hypothetical protein